MIMPRVRYKMPLLKRLVHYAKPLLKPVAKVLVLVCAIWGKYPKWLLTPDDPVSPFGCGTTPTASNEPTARAVYTRFGRYWGDVYWLCWRNSMYGLSYWLKPDWLKGPAIRYEDLMFGVDEGNPKRFWVRCPDGTWLWETQRKFGPFILITGYRIEPIINGAKENLLRQHNGEARAPRPGFHPNMDGRPIVSLRTARTM